jgi:hypothetical protein
MRLVLPVDFDHRDSLLLQAGAGPLCGGCIATATGHATAKSQVGIQPEAQSVRGLFSMKSSLAPAESAADFSGQRRLRLSVHRERPGATCHQNIGYIQEFLMGDRYDTFAG